MPLTQCRLATQSPLRAVAVGSLRLRAGLLYRDFRDSRRPGNSLRALHVRLSVALPILPQPRYLASPRWNAFTTVEEVLADIAHYRGFHSGQWRGNAERWRTAGPAQILQGGAARLQGSMDSHTALDTSGCLGHLADDELLADVDLVLLDIKAATGRRCRSLTGAELKPTIQFAEDLAAINKAVWRRYVLVPGLTDRLDEIASPGDLPPGWANVERVDVLPFHKLGEHKWRDLGWDYRLERVQPPSPELLEQARETFRSRTNAH